MKELFIGRQKAVNDIVLDDAKISREHHCKCVFNDDGTITITDLGSTNGVFVNGNRITKEMVIDDTSLVKIGGVEISGLEIRKWFDGKEHAVVLKCKRISHKYE